MQLKLKTLVVALAVAAAPAAMAQTEKAEKAPKAAKAADAPKAAKPAAAKPANFKLPAYAQFDASIGVKRDGWSAELDEVNKVTRKG